MLALVWKLVMTLMQRQTREPRQAATLEKKTRPVGVALS